MVYAIISIGSSPPVLGLDSRDSGLDTSDLSSAMVNRAVNRGVRKNLRECPVHPGGRRMMMMTLNYNRTNKYT